MISLGRSVSFFLIFGLFASSVNAEDLYAKMRSCRFLGQALIGKTKYEIRQKCGIYSDRSATTTAAGTIETWTYGSYRLTGKPLYSIIIQDDRVIAIQDY